MQRGESPPHRLREHRPEPYVLHEAASAELYPKGDQRLHRFLTAVPKIRCSLQLHPPADEQASSQRHLPASVYLSAPESFSELSFLPIPGALEIVFTSSESTAKRSSSALIPERMPSAAFRSDSVDYQIRSLNIPRSSFEKNPYN